MPEIKDHEFHRLYGPARKRITYKKTDYADYLLMLGLCAALLVLVFRDAPWLLVPGLVLCALLALSFPLRHGAAWAMPVLLREPAGVLTMLLHKARNMKPAFFLALGVLALDQLFIRATPDLPHAGALMGKIALGLFYAHLILLSAYRTVILVTHLRARGTVREVLLQTAWKGALERQSSVPLQIVHAYATGLLTHLVLLAPWYLLITHLQFSALSVAVVCVLNVATHVRHLRTYGDWFYRDHWLAHNAEFDFVYLHGPHHDAIPCALIGVSGNGFLEGFMRSAMGNPTAMYSPLIGFLLYSLEVAQDMKMHQYIPGIYPSLPRSFHEVAQHSTHHFGRLEPYGIGLRRDPAAPAPGPGFSFPPEGIINSIALDEELNGFQWDNPRYRQFMELYDKYHKP